MIGILASFLDGLFLEAMLVSGRVSHKATWLKVRCWERIPVWINECYNIIAKTHQVYIDILYMLIHDSVRFNIRIYCIYWYEHAKNILCQNVSLSIEQSQYLKELQYRSITISESTRRAPMIEKNRLASFVRRGPNQQKNIGTLLREGSTFCKHPSPLE